MDNISVFLPKNHADDLKDLDYTKDETALMITTYTCMHGTMKFSDLLSHINDLPNAYQNLYGPLDIYQEYIRIMKKSHGLETVMMQWLMAYPMQAEFNDSDPEHYFTPSECADQNMLDMIMSTLVPRYEDFMNLVIDVGNNDGALIMHRLLKTYAGTERSDILSLPDPQGDLSLWYLKDTSSDAYWLKLSQHTGKPVLIDPKYKVYLDYIDLARTYSDDGQKLCYVANLNEKGQALYDSLPETEG